MGEAGRKKVSKEFDVTNTISNLQQTLGCSFLWNESVRRERTEMTRSDLMKDADRTSDNRNTAGDSLWRQDIVRGRETKTMNQTPVILVCYNRPHHTKIMLEALEAHNVRDLIIFADAPKTERDIEGVQATRGHRLCFCPLRSHHTFGRRLHSATVFL
jgi:hypothetical protein